MNLQSLYYFKELTQDMNMTRTAERLFISQQTLSNHILRLEEYYGIKLFTRKRRLILTDAGIYLRDFASSMLKQDKHIQDVFADLKSQNRGFLRVGASPLRASTCLPHVLPAFSAVYPNVEMQLTNDNSDTLQQKVIDGDVDIALCIMNEDLPTLETELMLHDQIYLCISERLLDKYYPEEKSTLKQSSVNGARLQDFSQLPYFIMSTANHLGTAISRCFEEAGFSPRIYLSSKYTSLADSICSNALAACFMTQVRLLYSLPMMSEDINIFPILYKNRPLYHNLFLVHHKKRYFPKYAQYFCDLLRTDFKTINTTVLSFSYEDPEILAE